MYTYILSLLGLPLPHLTLLVTTKHGAELPVLYIRFPLAVCLTHGRIYMSIPISQFITVPLPHPMSMCPFSKSACLFLLCRSVPLCHFSRFHMYAWIHDICFSLYDLLHSVERLLVHPHLNKWPSFIPFMSVSLMIIRITEIDNKIFHT